MSRLWPFEMHYFGEMNDGQLLLRTEGRPPSTSDIARALSEIDPRIRLREPTTVAAMFAEVIAAPRFNLALLSTFALLALVLSAVGLYGVIAYSVTQRTREIGIRMALGARPAAVLALVLRQGALMTLAGVAVGLGAAAVATRAMRGMLYEVSPLDPGTFALVGVALGVVALSAAYVPARRASKVDPAIALRSE